jgi:hypothetical protein
MRKWEIREDGGNHQVNLRLQRLLCVRQFTIPDIAGTCLNLVCNNIDMRSSEPHQASQTHDFAYPLISSPLFPPSSCVSPFLVHNPIIISKYKVQSCLFISAAQDQELSLSTVYTKYNIHCIQCTPSTASSKEFCLPFIIMIQCWLVLAMIPYSDRFYYSGSMKTRTWPVRSVFVPNGSLTKVHEYSSDTLVFGTCNMELQMVHRLVVSDFWYI